MECDNREIGIWFEREIKAYDGRLRAYLQKQESEPADVEDIVQESYMRIIEVKKRREIRSPKGLLFRIAKNVSNDRVRKKYRENTFSVGEIDEVNDLPEEEGEVDEADRAKRVAMLESALRSLPEKCRIIMLLRTYENLSYKQIAARLNISVKTVETQLARGLKKCRKHFKQNGCLFDE